MSLKSVSVTAEVPPAVLSRVTGYLQSYACLDPEIKKSCEAEGNSSTTTGNFKDLAARVSQISKIVADNGFRGSLQSLSRFEMGLSHSCGSQYSSYSGTRSRRTAGWFTCFVMKMIAPRCRREGRVNRLRAHARIFSEEPGPTISEVMAT